MDEWLRSTSHSLSRDKWISLKFLIRSLQLSNWDFVNYVKQLMPYVSFYHNIQAGCSSNFVAISFSLEASLKAPKELSSQVSRLHLFIWCWNKVVETGSTDMTQGLPLIFPTKGSPSLNWQEEAETSISELSTLWLGRSDRRNELTNQRPQCSPWIDMKIQGSKRVFCT